MAVLLNEYKKIQFLVDSLVLPFIKNNHPKWRELISTYLEYLDNNSLFKSMNITDNVDANEMYTELLDDFLELYFKDVVDLDKFGLNDDNKRLFISLSKLIGNLKSTKTSFGFFFNSFSDFSIPSDSGDIGITDMAIELNEKPEWWLLNNSSTRPYTYVFKIDTPELSNLKELIKRVHPAGWLQLFLFEVDGFEEFMNGHDCFELDIKYGAHYNGKWNYDGEMDVLGEARTLYYNGGYTIADDINCAPIPRFFGSSPYTEFDFASAFGSEWFSPIDMVDYGSGGAQHGLTIDNNYNLYTYSPISQTIYKMDGMTSRNLASIPGFPAGYESWQLQTMSWNKTTDRLCVVMRDDKFDQHWIELVGFTTEIALDIHLEYIGAGVFTESMRQLQYDAQRDLLVGISTGYSGSYHNYIITFNYSDGSLYEGGWHGKLLGYTNALKYCVLDVSERKIYIVDAYVGDDKILIYDYLAYIGTNYASKIGEIPFNTRSIGEFGIALDPNGDMWMAGQKSSSPYDNLVTRYMKISNVPNPGVPLTFASKASPAYLNHPEVPGIVLDITDPVLDIEGLSFGGQLIFEMKQDQGDDYQNVWGDGTFIYAAGGGGGLRSYSVDGAGNLTYIDSDDQSGDYRGVWGDGNFVFATDGLNFGNGLMSYAVDGSGNLTFKDSDFQGSDPGTIGYRGVWGDGNFVYVACTGMGLRSYSVDGNGMLTHIDTSVEVDAEDYYGVWGDGTVIFVACDLDGLRTYSVDSSGMLTYIDVDMQGSAGYLDVWGDGNFIYVATYDEGIKVYSVSPGPDNYFDDSYYSILFGAFGEWDDVNQEWDSTDLMAPPTQTIGLTAEGEWKDGYDPVNVSITFDNIGGGSDTFDVNIQFVAGNDVNNTGVVISNGVPYEIDLSGGGIGLERITVINTGTDSGTFSITNIVFNYNGGILTYIGADNQGGNYYGVWGDGDFIYTACRFDGIRSYTVGGAGELTFIDDDKQGSAGYLGVWGDGNFVYAACDFDGLRSYSVEPPEWISYLDDTVWTSEGLWGSWDGSKWDSEGAKSGHTIWLDELGTWVEGFRPTRLRVTHTKPGTIYLRLRDAEQTGIIIITEYTSGDEIPIPFQGFDIKEIQIGTGEADPYSVTNIEFTGSYRIAKFVFKDADSQSGENVTGIWADDSFVFAACSLDGLRTYSVDGAGVFTALDAHNQTPGESYNAVWSDGNYIYVGSSGDLLSYSVDGAGNLTYRHSVSALFTGYNDVCGDGTYIFSTNMGTTAGLRSHSVADGVLTYLSNVVAGAGLSMHFDGTFIFVATATGLRSFSINSGTGATTLEDTDDQGGIYREVWGDGEFIYAQTDEGIISHSVDGSGNITFISSNPDGKATSGEAGLWGDGNFIYTGCSAEGIKSFSRDGAGNLTLVDTDDQGGQYGDVYGDGNFVYVCSSNSILSYQVI
jgi:hypothetical protein